MTKDKLIFEKENANEEYISNFISSFIDKNIIRIRFISKKTYNDNSEVSFLAFKQIISDDLKNACASFIKNNHDPSYIEAYLLSSINKISYSILSENKKVSYICPGCKYLLKNNFVEDINNVLHCNNCKNLIETSDNIYENKLYKVFSEHSKKGYKCKDCGEFIPDNKKINISCPYPKCFYVGDVSELKTLKHPFIKTNKEVLYDKDYYSSIKVDEDNILSERDLTKYLNILYECIDYQSKNIQFKGNNSTYLNKFCMYEAYKNIIDQYPQEMISYLICLNKQGKIQHKIFQEYIKILESKIPFTFKQNNKTYEVKSILDDNLCIFDGISCYVAAVDNHNEIFNETEEIYIGGRKGSYYKPYYIGKVVDVINLADNKSILHLVEEYSFFKIKMKKEIPPGTETYVEHMRIPPHYQMGGMVYLNRIRRAIVDRVYFVIHGKKRLLKNNEEY